MREQAPILTQAAQFLAGLRFDQLPQDVVKTAKQAFLDYLGVAIAGSDQPVVQNLKDWAVKRSHEQSASLIGSSLKLDVENAALVNAAAGHALDFDDTSWTTIGHPSTVIFPALMALAQKHDYSGKDLLTAYVAGVEVSHKVAHLMMPEASENGWHTTGIFYALGTTAAACQLLKLDETASVCALALALSRSSGIRSNFGTQAKPYHAGMAAKAGLEALSLAQQGITASPSALEAEDGFIQCFGSAALAKKARHMARPILFGTPWDISSQGYAFKKYPNCSGNHPACDVLLAQMAKQAIPWQEIESIRCGVSLLGPKELVCHLPKTPVEARFSLEFSIACALIYGQITLDEFQTNKIQHPEVQSLMKKVTMQVDDDLAKLGFIGTAPIKIWLHFKDGTTEFYENDLAQGNPEKPFDDADFNNKFLGCVKEKLSNSDANLLLSSIHQLDTLDVIQPIIALATNSK